jgi:hypothetical protein
VSTEPRHLKIALTLQMIGIVGLLIVQLIGVNLASDLSGDYVADPTKPFALDQTPPTNLTYDLLWSSPITYLSIAFAAVVLVSVLWNIVHLASQDAPFSMKPTLPLVAAFVIVTCGITGSGEVSTDSTDHTFATWAKQRYGIELEAYPVQTGLFDHGEVDTTQRITLDDGQEVRVVKITDARAETGLLITDHTDGSGEMPTRTEQDSCPVSTCMKD